jgi:hypothetical protein
MPLNGALGVVRLICSPVPHNLESSHKNTRRNKIFILSHTKNKDKNLKEESTILDLFTTTNTPIIVGA